MGYVPRRTLYKLDFSQTAHAGLEVTTRSAPMGVMLEVLSLGDLADERGLKNISREQVDRVFGLFADVLVEWNVETEDGQQVPATRDGLLSQDPEFVMAVMTAWAVEMSKAPPPLPSGSSGGGPSQASIPMTPLSPGS